MSINPRNGRDTIRMRFSGAAKGVTELYREALHAYDTGYRDALLHMHHFVLLLLPPSPSTTTAAGVPTALTGVPSPNGQQQIKAVLPPTSPQMVDAERLIQFIQSSLKRREAITAASREISRRRKRSEASLYGDQNNNKNNNSGTAWGEDDRGGPFRRLQSLTEESTEVERDILRTVHVSRPAESDVGSSEDEFSAEL